HSGRTDRPGLHPGQQLRLDLGDAPGWGGENGEGGGGQHEWSDSDGSDLSTGHTGFVVHGALLI
ncbi:MAG: hypothetical protein V3T74_09100, partial [Gemmatimonadales bacterium]